MDNGQDPAQYVHCYLSLSFFYRVPRDCMADRESVPSVVLTGKAFPRRGH